MVYWVRASAVATRKGICPRLRRSSRASRRCSHWRDTVAPVWKVKDRGLSTGTSAPAKAAMSRARRPASPSSAHTATTGRPVTSPRAAAKWARWTAARPDTAAGQAPPSMAVSSCRNSGRSFRAQASSFMAVPHSGQNGLETPKAPAPQREGGIRPCVQFSIAPPGRRGQGENGGALISPRRDHRGGAVGPADGLKDFLPGGGVKGLSGSVAVVKLLGGIPILPLRPLAVGGNGIVRAQPGVLPQPGQGVLRVGGQGDDDARPGAPLLRIVSELEDQVGAAGVDPAAGQSSRTDTGGPACPP